MFTIVNYIINLNNLNITKKTKKNNFLTLNKDSSNKELIADIMII